MNPAPTGDREFMPQAGDDLPPGERPMVLYEIYADTDAFRAYLATDHVANFFTELAQHSTTDAKALLPSARALPRHVGNA